MSLAEIKAPLFPELEDIDRDGYIETRNIVHEPGSTREQQVDLNQDGKPDVFRFFGSDSKLQRTLHDKNFDGFIDLWEFSSRQLPLVHVHKADINFDRKVDRIVYVRLLEEKLQYQKFLDKNGDGVFDSQEVSEKPEL